jgi:hypothetical protein
MNLQTLIFEQCSCQNKNSVFQDPICCGNSVLFSNNGVAGSWWTGGTKMPLMRTSLTFLSSIQNAGWSQATQVQVGKRMMWVRQPGWWNPAWVCNSQLQVNHCSPIGTSLIISPIGQIKNPNNGFYIGWSFFLLFKLAQIFNSRGTLFFCVPFPKGLFFIKKLKLLLRATTYLIIHRFHVMQLNFFFSSRRHAQIYMNAIYTAMYLTKLFRWIRIRHIFFSCTENKPPYLSIQRVGSRRRDQNVISYIAAVLQQDFTCNSLLRPSPYTESIMSSTCLAYKTVQSTIFCKKKRWKELADVCVLAPLDQA